MRANQLDQSLLSSSHFVMQDKRNVYTNEPVQDIDLGRLYRKFNKAVPELHKECAKNLSKPILCPFIFSPQSKFIIFWQVISILLIYLYFLQIPIIISFQYHRSLQKNEAFFQIINTPAIFTFICGIFINMNTSFYAEGLLRKDPLQIRNKYFRTNLLFDIISILAIAIYQILEITKQFDNPKIKIFIALFYLKIFQLLRIQRTIISSFDLNRRIKAFLKLMLMLLKIFIICNLVACFGFYISDYQSKNSIILNKDGSRCTTECFWVLKTTLADKSISQYNDFVIPYIYSLYWASTTMISIGYGDITPKNPSEICYTILIQFLSCLLYAYSINQIWSIIQQLNAKRAKINSRLNIINLYMRDKYIRPQLISRINAYLNNYYYAKNLRQREIQAQIIHELTPALRKQLFYQSYNIIFSNTFFKKADIQLMQEASCFVKQVGYYEAEAIFINQSSKRPCLYYIQKGQMTKSVCQTNKITFRTMYNGDTIGYYEFFTQLDFKCQIKALKYTLAYQLQFSDWRSILKNYKKDFQRFYEAKDEIILYNNHRVIQYKCYFCNSKQHRTEDCFDKELRRIVGFSMRNYRQQQSNERKQYTRKQFISKIEIRDKKRLPRKRSGNDFKNKQRNKSYTKQSYIQQSSKVEDNTPKRKLSVDESFFSDRSKNSKIIIKSQKLQYDTIKAVQRIRKEYYQHDGIEEDSEESSKEEEIKFQELDMDRIATYNDYYPNFNACDLNFRETNKKRFTKSFAFL